MRVCVLKQHEFVSKCEASNCRSAGLSRVHKSHNYFLKLRQQRGELLEAAMLTVTVVVLIRFKPKRFRPPLKTFAANLKEHNASRVYTEIIVTNGE